MNDPRLVKLAETLLDHSCRLKSGEKVLIEAFDLPDPAIVCQLVELASARGAVPLVSCKNNRVLRSLYQTATKQSMQSAGSFEAARMSEMDAYIGIRGAENSNEFSDVPSARMDLYQQHWWQAVHSEIRVPNTRWVVLRYPMPAMAQAARMSTPAFEDFYFEVCTTDYSRMAKNLAPLRELMLATDAVHITGPETDISFSIRDMPVIPCFGERNIPDGECFTAPLRDSVNGHIRFNTPTLYQGTVFDGVRLEFQDGKIVDAQCRGNDERLNAILDSDEGARYIGEWSLGTNNFVKQPMLDILFDEKIGGSFHLTPGSAYDEADNGNRSRVHWDMVLIQTPPYGGGKIQFDGNVVRKDGRFTVAALEPLNAGL